MLKRPVFSLPLLTSRLLRAFSAAVSTPASTRQARDLNATSISVKPDFSLTSSAKLIEAEKTYSAHNYHPLPVVFSRAQGVHVWDPEGKRYFDFLSAYSSVNQGHSHPAIVAAAVKQMQNVSLSSRAFHNDVFPVYSKYVTQYFGYDAVLPMNTGAEAVETAIKIGRKWATDVKGVPSHETLVLSACGCFHGRTMVPVSMSCDPGTTNGFGPQLPGFIKVPYNDPQLLQKAMEIYGDRLACFIVEPIQGEAGVVVPEAGYLSTAAALCKKHNVLFIGDEIQTGIARTGRLLACDHDGVRPDIVILGKALSGGVYPVSAALCDWHIMQCITPGTHGSTFGGNPVGCAAAIAALQVVQGEGLVQRAEEMGHVFRAAMLALQKGGCSFISEVRGKGLLNAVEVDPSKVSAWDLCIKMAAKGLLAKPTHNCVIRFAPPLIMTDGQMQECIAIISDVFLSQ